MNYLSAMKQLIAALIMIFLVSCGGEKTDKKQPAPGNNLTAVQIDPNSADSLCMENILKEAIDSAYTNLPSGRFKKEFTPLCDSLYNVEVTLTMDHFFSPNEKHLIIHMRSPNENMYNIYLVQDKSFIKVASHDEDGSGLVVDTLQDVNGDGIKDYLINWYGRSGCCLKNFYVVFLYQPQSGTFSNEYMFVNPTFSAKEQVIRGVNYGHAGETSMYKYKWNGLQVDTLERIYFEKDNKDKKTGKVIKKTTTKEERLNQAPAEYRHIYGYDWFLGK